MSLVRWTKRSNDRARYYQAIIDAGRMHLLGQQLLSAVAKSIQYWLIRWQLYIMP